MLGNTTYDRLKPVAQIWLPAAGTLYFALAAIWGLPAADEVVGTIVALDTFLGVILGVSSSKYNDTENPAGRYDGDLTVFKSEDGGAAVAMDFNKLPPEIVERGEVLLKVNALDRKDLT